ncbi:MAG: OmpA/MotB domain protein [Myxococcales bacterium]|nr:OmpA/MotB domain protein [Myxococcales bacterium]
MNRLFRPTPVVALGAAVFALGGLLSSPAHANVEIGGTAGIHVFSDTNELGVADVPDANSQRNSALFGLRLGAFFGDMIGVEGEFGVVPSEPRALVFDIWNITYRAHLVAQFRASNPATKLIPFVLVGGGAFQVVDSRNTDVIDEDTDEMLYAGIGAKYRVDNGWGLRADARILFPPSSEDDGFTQDFEVLLSIYREFGRKEVVKTIEAPPQDNDPDKDGIIGDADKCPQEPEDMDGFEDDNGCPDADNDADGIADAADKCPMEPEDKDAFQDEDGCPDPDNDGDGVPDAADKCAMEPEDKDNFEDDDGCPDPDNDGDGVPDAQDKCASDPETKNGYQDEDGCPDEIPAKIKAFTGVIQGINFRTNTADLSPISFRTLDKAVAVLVEFPELRLEVQGHTDDQPIKKGGKFADNLELSKARAEAVREYFIKKGVAENRLTATGFGDSAPVESPTGLKGGKLNAARAKNRRVEFRLVSALTNTAPAPTPAPATAPATTPAPAPNP